MAAPMASQKPDSNLEIFTPGCTDYKDQAMILSHLGTLVIVTVSLPQHHTIACIFAAGAQAHKHRPGPLPVARSGVAERVDTICCHQYRPGQSWLIPETCMQSVRRSELRAARAARQASRQGNGNIVVLDDTSKGESSKGQIQRHKIRQHTTKQKSS